MKKYLAFIANILIIFIGLLALGAPYVTDAIVAIGLGGFTDPALMQPLFIFLVVVAIYGLASRARTTLSFMPIILEFVVGIVGYLFIFPFQNLIVGYLSLAAIVYIMIAPIINKQLNKKNIVKIKI